MFDRIVKMCDRMVGCTVDSFLLGITAFSIVTIAMLIIVAILSYS